jgi:hypothetical protein
MLFCLWFSVGFQIFEKIIQILLYYFGIVIVMDI